MAEFSLYKTYYIHRYTVYYMVYFWYPKTRIIAWQVACYPFIFPWRFFSEGYQTVVKY